MLENQDKRSFIRYKNVGTSFFRFVTMHASRHTATDGERRSQYRALQYMQYAVARKNTIVASNTMFQHFFSGGFREGRGASRLQLALWAMDRRRHGTPDK